MFGWCLDGCGVVEMHVRKRRGGALMMGKEGARGGYIGDGGLAIYRGNAWHSCAGGSLGER